MLQNSLPVRSSRQGEDGIRTGGGADAQIGKPGSVPSVSTFRSTLRSAWHPAPPTVVCLGYIVAPSLISQIVGDLLQSMLQSVWASPAPGPLTQWEKHACIRFGIWVAVDYIRWVSTICVCCCCSFLGGFLLLIWMILHLGAVAKMCTVLWGAEACFASFSAGFFILRDYGAWFCFNTTYIRGSACLIPVSLQQALTVETWRSFFFFFLGHIWSQPPCNMLLFNRF